MSDATTSPIPSVDALERARLGDEIDRWVLRPLRWLPIAGQVWLTFGAHAFIAWAFGAQPGTWDGQWVQAWVAILLLDGALLVTYHAKNSRRLPPKAEDPVAHRIALGVIVPAFLVSIAANFGNRVLNANRGVAPEALAAFQGVVSGLAVAIPFGLVLLAVPLYGRVKVWRDSMRRADDVERVAAAEVEAERAQQERRRADKERARAAGRALAREAQHRATDGHGETGETGERPAPAVSRPAESASPAASRQGKPGAAECDAVILAAWERGTTKDDGTPIDGAWVDDRAGTRTAGRARLRAVRDGLAMVRDDRAAGLGTPAADAIDERLKAAGHRPAGLGARLLASPLLLDHDSETSTAAEPALVAVPGETASETTGETSPRDGSETAA